MYNPLFIIKEYICQLRIIEFTDTRPQSTIFTKICIQILKFHRKMSYLCLPVHENVKVMLLSWYIVLICCIGGGSGTALMIHMLVFACLSGFPLACVTCTIHTSLPLPFIRADTPYTQHMLFTFSILIHVHVGTALVIFFLLLPFFKIFFPK